MSLKQKTIKGLFWSFSSQGGKQAAQFIITVILARLLSPNDFGLVGMAVVFTGFADVFKDLGISKALIQKQDIDQRHLSTAFWINIGFGLLLTLVIMGISPIIAQFYGKPEIRSILMLLSLNFIFSSFTIIQQTILVKEMDFRSLTIRDMVAITGAGSIGIYMAYSGFGVWSLVSQMLSYTILNGILLWRLSRWRPKLIFSYDAIKDMIHFSVNFTGFNIVNYLARNVDYLLIGRFLGAQSLGIYALAHKLMMAPLTNISWVITRVMFPAFSKINHDLARLRNIYLKITRFISYIAFPLVLGLFIVAPELVGAVFGPKWSTAIVLIRILCVCSLFHSIYTTTTSIILSQARSDLLFKLSIFNVLCVASAIFFGLRWGLVGVALSYTIEQIVWVIFVQRITNSLIKMDSTIFIKNLSQSIIISLVMFTAVLVLKQLVNWTGIISLVFCVFLGISIYLLLMMTLEKKNLKEMISNVYART